MLRKTLPVILMFMIMGCVGLQQKWEQLTPDEKARVILADMQGQLKNMFQLGKAYVEANPDKRAMWQKQVLPAIEASNRAIGVIMAGGATEKLTPDQIYFHCQMLIDTAFDAMRKMGVML